jgi:hypothetical protein
MKLDSDMDDYFKSKPSSAPALEAVAEDADASAPAVEMETAKEE